MSLNPSTPAKSATVAADPVDTTAPSSTATPTANSTKSEAMPAAPSNPSSPKKPRYHVQSIDSSYSIYGVDAIWHNQYCGPNSDFISFRKQFDCDINALLLKVAKHVEMELYFVISMSASPHFLSVVCGCERMMGDMPEDMWDDPAFKDGDKCPFAPF